MISASFQILVYLSNVTVNNECLKVINTNMLNKNVNKTKAYIKYGQYILTESQKGQKIWKQIAGF